MNKTLSQLEAKEETLALSILDATDKNRQKIMGAVIRHWSSRQNKDTSIATENAKKELSISDAAILAMLQDYGIKENEANLQRILSHKKQS